MLKTTIHFIGNLLASIDFFTEESIPERHTKEGFSYLTKIIFIGL